MSQFLQQMVRCTNWFDERQARERALILATVTVVILLTGWQFWVVPALEQVRTTQSEIASVRATRDSLITQQAALQQRLAQDPSAELRQRLESRQQRLERLDQQITETTGRLIPPRAMVVMLQDMLATEDGLELQGVELLAPEPVFTDRGEADEVTVHEEALLYAHEVDIRVRGGYLEVLRYMERLEAMDERLGWVLLEYDASAWPNGEARVRVRTLSLEPAWLGV